MDVQGERILIIGDSLSHPGADSSPTIQDITQGSNRTSSAPGDLLASLLLEQGAKAARIDAKVGRSAISFLNNEPVEQLVASDQVFAPTKVIVMLGTNDIGRDLGATEQAMTQIRDAYTSMGAEVWAIGPMTYVSPADNLNVGAPDVLTIMQSVFGADKTIDARPLAVLEGRTGDGVHFTAAAAAPTADALAAAVRTAGGMSKLKKGLIVAGVAIAGIALTGYAWRSLQNRQLLGPIGMLVSPKLVGPALMAYDASRNASRRIDVSREFDAAEFNAPQIVGYRVAYLAQGAQRTLIDDVLTFDEANKVLRSLKRRGLTTWVEDQDGGFVPVKGATRLPKHRR